MSSKKMKKTEDVLYRIVGRFGDIVRNVIEGAGTAIDIAAIRPRRVSHFQTDAAALQSDWDAVGRDLENSARVVMGEIASSNPNNLRKRITVYGRGKTKPSAKDAVRVIRISKRGIAQRGR